MDGIVADQVAGLPGEGEGRTPLLALDGYNGPLERLLTLARAHQVDLARLSLPDLVDQLAAALRHAPPAMPLGQKGDWVVMASWLLQLRSLLLLPADTQAHRTGEDEADRLRDRLVGLQEMQALAGWLDRRPQLGREVFARGQPEALGISTETGHEVDVDVIEFLWASLALFDDDSADADATSWYLPRWLDLYSIPGARTRILRLLAETPEGHRLDQLLPEGPDVEDPDGAEAETQPVLRRRSAWTSTFIASLELARQGEVTLAQDDTFAPIQVSPASAPALARADGVTQPPAAK